MISRSASRRTTKQLSKQTLHSCVAVVGLPRCELEEIAANEADGGVQDAPVSGVGKSCLCTRFVLPSHEEYAASEESHDSSVSSAEFSGREIAGAHYNYFGTVLKLIDGRSVVFHVVEHTTFTDSTSGDVHPGGESYEERAAADSLRCPLKVSYIGAKFRGIALQAREKFPKRFTKRSGPGGGVRGYVLVLDPTLPDALVKAQVDLLARVADRLLSRGQKPHVVVLSKCDECDCARKEVAMTLLREQDVLADAAVFETSARQGVGVEEAFAHLQQQMMRRSSHACRTLTRNGSGGETLEAQARLALPNMSFSVAVQAMGEAREQAFDGVLQLLRSTVDDAGQQWTPYLERVGQNESLAALMSLAGRAFCRTLFKKRLVELKVKALESGGEEGAAGEEEEEGLQVRLQSFFSTHPDFLVVEQPLDISPDMQPPSLEEFEVQEEDGGKPAIADEAQVEFYFRNAVCDVFGPEWYTSKEGVNAEDGLHPIAARTASASSAGGDFHPEPTTSGHVDRKVASSPKPDGEAEEGGEEAEDGDECCYVTCITYQDGVHQSRNLFHHLTQAAISRGSPLPPGDYIELVAPNICSIEEASESSDEDLPSPQGMVLSGEHAADLPGEHPTEAGDVTSARSKGTLRAGLSTLRTALKDSSTKTTALLSKVRRPAFGKFRKPSKEKEDQVASGRKSPAIFAIMPTPSLTITSPPTSPGKVNGGAAAAVEQPDGVSGYEDDQELYECVADVSCNLSVSSAEGLASSDTTQRSRSASDFEVVDATQQSRSTSDFEIVANEVDGDEVYAIVDTAAEPVSPRDAPNQPRRDSLSVDVGTKRHSRTSAKVPLSPRGSLPPPPALPARNAKATSASSPPQASSEMPAEAVTAAPVISPVSPKPKPGKPPRPPKPMARTFSSLSGSSAPVDAQDDSGLIYEDTEEVSQPCTREASSASSDKHTSGGEAAAPSSHEFQHDDDEIYEAMDYDLSEPQEEYPEYVAMTTATMQPFSPWHGSSLQGNSNGSTSGHLGSPERSGHGESGQHATDKSNTSLLHGSDDVYDDVMATDPNSKPADSHQGNSSMTSLGKDLMPRDNSLSQLECLALEMEGVENEEDEEAIYELADQQSKPPTKKPPARPPPMARKASGVSIRSSSSLLLSSAPPPPLPARESVVLKSKSPSPTPPPLPPPCQSSSPPPLPAAEGNGNVTAQALSSSTAPLTTHASQPMCDDCVYEIPADEGHAVKGDSSAIGSKPVPPVKLKAPSRPPPPVPSAKLAAAKARSASNSGSDRQTPTEDTVSAGQGSEDGGMYEVPDTSWSSPASESTPGTKGKKSPPHRPPQPRSDSVSRLSSASPNSDRPVSASPSLAKGDDDATDGGKGKAAKGALPKARRRLNVMKVFRK